MRIVIQRVTTASVLAEGLMLGRIGPGLCVFLAVAAEDTTVDADYLADKISTLRIFEDAAKKMNRSVTEAQGQLLVVSEFTLYGDCAKGRRPSFARAAAPDVALRLNILSSGSAAPASMWRRDGSRLRWRSPWSTTAR